MKSHIILSSLFRFLHGGDRSYFCDVYLCGYVYCFKGVGDFSSPDMRVRYFLLLVSLTFFGVTIRSSVLRS